MHAVLPTAPCHVLDGGHAIHLDARREVAALLVAFLADTATAAAADHEHIPYG